MPTYQLPLNIIVFVVAFWAAVIYGLVTRDLLGSGLWLTAGFAGLTAERLTPARSDDADDAA